MDLKQLYKIAAQQAFNDKVDAGNESALVAWIQAKCKYEKKNEFYLVLGIGCELADLQAQKQSYKNEVHRAFEIAIKKHPNTDIFS